MTRTFTSTTLEHLMEIAQDLLSLIAAAAATAAFAYIQLYTALVVGIVLSLLSAGLIIRRIRHRPVCDCCQAVIDDISSRPGAFDA